MRLRVVPIARGVADLGSWGSLHLTGAASALIKTRLTLDVELPPAVAESVPNATLVLNEADGALLILPNAGETVARVDLASLDDAYSSIPIPRDEDTGMRLAHVQLVDDGVLFMTERPLLFFDGDLRLVWRSDEEFVGWSFEKVADGQVHLIWSDWSGREARQVRSLRYGRRTG